MNCVDEIKRKLKMYGWDKKKVVSHYSKIEMIQIKWDKAKWKTMQIQWDGGSK